MTHRGSFNGQISSTFVAAFAAATVACAYPGSALAESEVYCDRVRAEAASQAALLLAPRVHLQALRVPRYKGAEAVELFGGSSEYQLRAAASWSLANAWAGLLTLDVADDACERHRAREALAASMRAGIEGAAALAARKALDFLDAQLEVVERIEEQARIRHARHLSDVMEFDQVQGLAMQIRRKRLDLARQVEPEPEPDPDGTHAGKTGIDAQIARFIRASDRYEEASSDLRTLRQWDVSIRLGAIPGPEPDYYGTVDFTYNLGGLFQSSAERRLLAARGEEVRSARHELPAEAKRLADDLIRDGSLLRQELDLRERELALLEARMETFEGSGSPQRLQALAIARLRRMLLRTEVIYARELLARRDAVVERDGGPSIDGR